MLNKLMTRAEGYFPKGLYLQTNTGHSIIWSSCPKLLELFYKSKLLVNFIANPPMKPILTMPNFSWPTLLNRTLLFIYKHLTELYKQLCAYKYRIWLLRPQNRNAG